ncbi:FMN-binding protein [Halanaerobium saccharolyticum]|uniref:FMN-binding protein n=1 Tax=Halanaerobium saccharolyticum TaxID=43595 RepID=A0A4R7YUE4_9FIRM|nr:FMN-binding protein [Halanaerobium saccharolyticum]RAK10278.1 FMN-binding protein [Halanaerobium saccharolyticum]TDW00490.1 FMN-binding protein [Halanaerobium saccharolyticum]TDX52075.1 FMN-binding protein [Halanaerobium saccharolyticum]
MIKLNKNQRGLIILVIMIFFFFPLSINAADTTYQDGRYLGYTASNDGDVLVELNINRGKIVDVNLLNPFKIDYKFPPGRKIFLEWPAKVLKKQSAEIDVVSGATESYNKYQKATQMALDIASGKYQENVYYGVAKDYKAGHLLLEVTIENNKITDLRIINGNPQLLIKPDGREKLLPAEPDNYQEAELKFLRNFPAKAIENQGEVEAAPSTKKVTKICNSALKMALEQAGIE